VEVLNDARSPGVLRRRLPIHRTVALAVVVVLGHCLAADSPEPIDEYQVKAAFIYNFAKFVQWPSESFQSSTAPISICVLGQDPFGRLLEDMVTGHLIERRQLIVRHVSAMTQVTGCQILFISSAEGRRSRPVITDVKTPGILTIGESDASLADGVVINFRLNSGRVRFDINLEAAEREKLRISSRLLSLAHITEANRK
jgi:hypothetical protein